MSTSSINTLKAQPQERPCDCSTRISTPEAAQVDKQYFESWSSGGQAVQQQGSSPFASPIRISTKGRFTIKEEEGSSPKLSFRLPSWGGSMAGQKGSAGASSALEAAAAGTAKAALTEPSSSHYQPAGMSSSGRKKSAAGALQMPGQKQ
ncbi:hypothetical protein OEZ86_004521 [Tetradesmus obliquus]|nr:hypothetical protein OEZ86_004521 [Tetradesmus obliquus]